MLSMWVLWDQLLLMAAVAVDGDGDDGDSDSEDSGDGDNENNENGGHSEATISDDDMNWSGRVCWMSLIIRRTGAYSMSHILSIY
jgi:hypothetical protein